MARCGRPRRRRAASPKPRGSASGTAIVPTSVADTPDLELVRVGTVHEALRPRPRAARETGPGGRAETVARAAIVSASSRTREPVRVRFPTAAPAEQEDPRPCRQRPDRKAMLAALRLVAPGRPLREGLDRIVQAKMGALVVIGDGPDVLALCSGGFLLDAEFTPQRLVRAGEDGRGDDPVGRTAAGSHGPTSSWSRTPTSRRSRPAPGTAPPSGSPSRSTPR